MTLFQLTKPGPVEIELIAAAGDRPAVTVTFNAKPTPLSLRAARRAAGLVYRALGTDADEAAGDAFARELIRHNIVSWSGIGDETDAPVEPTRDREIRDDDGQVIDIEFGTISAFLAEPRLVEAADAKWVLPWAQLDAEKNGFASAPTGTGAGETPASDIASSPVVHTKTDGATTTPEALAAPTIATSRKRTKAKRSGS